LYVLKHPKCPTAVKYSRGAAETLYEEQFEDIAWGKGQILKEGKDAVILSVGNMLPEAVKAIESLEKQGYKIGLVNPRFIKPMDKGLLDQLAETYPLIVTLEEGILNGGYGSMVMQYLMQKGYKGNIRNIGIEDQFVEHGSISELRSMLKIDGEHIAASMK